MSGAQTVAPPVERSQPTASLLSNAIDRARDCLLSLQKNDGHWVGELQGDTILESEYVLLLAFLGRENEETTRKCAAYILQQQRADGSWSNYPDGPIELSVSVKAYFALKLTGHDPEADYMRKARAVIRANGGAERCNSFTKFYLAFLGQFPYRNCASVPVELVLLPRWFYFNLYAMSSWTRTIVVPLSIFSACKPVRELPEHLGIRELFLEPPTTPRWPAEPKNAGVNWPNFFLGIDCAYKWSEKLGLLLPFRSWALRSAAAWMRERFADSDGLGAIFPPMIYTVIALRCLGVADDADEMKWALKQLEDLMIEEDGAVRLQPCFSPVWDTALTLNALSDVGLKVGNEAVARGASWLLNREVRRPGDWSIGNPGVAPAGWVFEYRNGFYPDVDDTAMVLMALTRSGAAADESALQELGNRQANCSPLPRFGGQGLGVRGSDLATEEPLTPNPSLLSTGARGAGLVPSVQEARNEGARPALGRGIHWLLSMQNRDGGWAAFDRDIDRQVLTQVPFADHNAMLDPSCPDITARVLEALGPHGFGPDHPHGARAISFLIRTQESSGSWPGRWGVNYLYGTWQVLLGLQAIGFDMQDPMVRRAVEWLKKVQQPGGGWGESCRSYDDPTYAGIGTPTASQTAWALLALLSAGERDSESVATGVNYLLSTQGADGNWEEEPFTGTGFPKVFYLKYHLYRLYFPLMALARYRAGSRGAV